MLNPTETLTRMLESLKLSGVVFILLMNIILITMLLCLCVTSHQQLRSYEDGATAYKSLNRQTGEAGDQK